MLEKDSFYKVKFFSACIKKVSNKNDGYSFLKTVIQLKKDDEGSELLKFPRLRNTQVVVLRPCYTGKGSYSV